MRRAFVELCLILVAIIGIHTTRIIQHSGFIKGKLYPAGPGSSVVAINGRDSVKVVSEHGYFGMRVKPGTWKVIIDVNDHGANVVRENLQVGEGQDINLGEIRMTE
ncbi:MAG TPA: hypothetical protein VMI35_09940 [Puia sp.]|nr:hypothetical protein [Puia sp.]